MKIQYHWQLDVYELSVEAAMEVFEISKKFPKEETYCLTDQMRRSSRSVSGQIAEGWRRRKYKAAFVNKLNEAEGEAAETQGWIEYAVKCNYCSREKGKMLHKKYDNIIGMLVNMGNEPDKWVLKNILAPFKTLSLSHFLTFSLSLLLFSCTRPQLSDEVATKDFCIPDSMLRRITIDTVKAENVMGQITLSGKISTDEEKQVKIYPLASGHVQQLKVALGDYVEAGQLLALVQSADVAGILSDASNAKYDLAIAKKNMEVTEDLYKSGISSEKDYLTAQKEYGKAQSTFNKSNEILKIYGSGEDNLSSYYIKAPISGFIVEKKVNEGMMIRSDAGDNLFTISDLKDVWALANVYETDIEKIKQGYDADVATLSYGDTIFKGKIDKVFNVLNPDTKVLNVRIKLDNQNYLLKPGMFARITVHYPQNKKMLAVNNTSVIFNENKNYVVLYRKRCDMEVQEVTVKSSSGGKSYIEADSLHEGDLVIERNGLLVFTALKQF